MIKENGQGWGVNNGASPLLMRSLLHSSCNFFFFSNNKQTHMLTKSTKLKHDKKNPISLRGKKKEYVATNNICINTWLDQF